MDDSLLDEIIDSSNEQFQLDLESLSITSDLSEDYILKDLEDRIKIENNYYTISIIRDRNKEKLYHRTKEGIIELYKLRMRIN